MKKLDVYEIQYNDQEKRYSVWFQKEGKMYTYGENKLLIVIKKYNKFSISRKTFLRKTNDGYLVGEKKLKYYKVKVFSLEDNDEDVKTLVEKFKNPIYSFCRSCWSCQKDIKIYTYLLYESDLSSMFYPWNKIRLNDEKTPAEYFLHTKDGKMEYYPFVILGDREITKKDGLGKLAEWDHLMTKWIPEIKVGSSKRAKEIFDCEQYVANHCHKCHRLQGYYFMKEYIDLVIQHMEALEIDCYIEDLMLLDLLEKKGKIEDMKLV